VQPPDRRRRGFERNAEFTPWFGLPIVLLTARVRLYRHAIAPGCRIAARNPQQSTVASALAIIQTLSGFLQPRTTTDLIPAETSFAASIVSTRVTWRRQSPVYRAAVEDSRARLACHLAEAAITRLFVY